MKILLVVAVLLCAIQNASAAFIDSGTFLTDTTSELDWLDVSTTRGLSYDDVSIQLGLPGGFFGWRYATGVEFTELLANATGLATSPTWLETGTVFPEGVGSVDGLISLLGVTCLFCGAGVNETIGFLAASGSGYDRFHVGILHDDGGFPVAPCTYGGCPGVDYAVLSIDGSHGIAQPYVGSFLVRQATVQAIPPTGSVPEPATVALFALGLAGLGFSRRKVKTSCLN